MRTLAIRLVVVTLFLESCFPPERNNQLLILSIVNAITYWAGGDGQVCLMPLLLT